MRGQRFAIRVELFPTRSLSNRSKHVFSAAGAAADRPAAPPSAQAAQKSQNRPLELPRPRQTDGRASKTLNLQTSFLQNLAKIDQNIGYLTSLAFNLPQPVWSRHNWEALETVCTLPFLVGQAHVLYGSGTHLQAWWPEGLPHGLCQQMQGSDEVGC